MTTWFDKRAVRAGSLTPEQQRKVRAIEAALGKSDRAIKDHLISIDTFGRSARKAKTGKREDWVGSMVSQMPRTTARANSERLMKFWPR